MGSGSLEYERQAFILKNQRQSLSGLINKPGFLMDLKKCEQSETAHTKDYKRQTGVRGGIGPNSPINHNCRDVFFMWLFCFNVGLNLIYPLGGKNSFFFICLFKKFIELPCSIVIDYLDRRTFVDGKKLVKILFFNYPNTNDTKFIFNLILFFNEIMSVGIFIYTYMIITERENRNNLISLQKW